MGAGFTGDGMCHAGRRLACKGLWGLIKSEDDWRLPILQTPGWYQPRWCGVGKAETEAKGA